MSGHSPWDELAVGLALGALEPEDEETFLGHLKGCAQCGQTVADIEAVSGQLAFAVPAEDPPPALLKSIMREVEASGRARSPLASALPSVARLRVPARRKSTHAAAPGEPHWLMRAASLLVVLALVGWNYQLRLDNRVKARSLENASQAGLLLADPKTKVVTLEGTGSERATVLVNGDRAYLVVDNFKRNDSENSIYVLWTQRQTGGMEGVDKFKVAHGGPSYVPVRKALADSSGIQVFAVSKETGSEIPKTPSNPIVIGKPGVSST